MDLDEYNFPKNDVEAYLKYPKFNWVYTTTRLLDSQRIHWLPFEDSAYPMPLAPFGSPFGWEGTDGNLVHTAISGQVKNTECAILKGDVKWMAHRHNTGFEEEVVGEVDIRIHAFVVLYLKKFTGFVSFRTMGGDIVEVSLRPSHTGMKYYPEEAIKLFKKCYPKER